MKSLFKNIENDLVFIDKEMQKIKIRISTIPEHNKRDYQDFMRLLSVFRKDKISLVNSYHNIMQDINYKNKLLEAQRTMFEIEAMNLMKQDNEQSEFDEEYEQYYEDLLKRASENVAILSEGILNEE